MNIKDDLISREALKEAISKVVAEERKEDERWAAGLRYALTLIDNAQAIEQNWRFYYDHGYAQAKRDLGRPQGKWIYEKGKANSVFRCSNCGRFYPHDIFMREDDDRYTRLEREDANRFCWHCGADMRGSADNEETDK